MVGSPLGTVCRFAHYGPWVDIYKVDRRLHCETRSLPNVAFGLDPEGLARPWREVPGKIPIARLAGKCISKITWANPPPQRRPRGATGALGRGDAGPAILEAPEMI